MREVLIAGGSGLIGRRLSEVLLQSGYKVSIITRSASNIPPVGIKEYIWDPNKGILPDEAILNADYVVNLSGATIGKRWTQTYKKELIRSRVEATTLLAEKLNTLPHNVMSLLNISGLGYYGNNYNTILDENSPPNSEFISQICQQWEGAARLLNQETVKLFILRLATVVSGRGGAVPQMAGPIKLFVGAALGEGTQCLPWVHIDDVCHAILVCIENPEKAGTYNIVSPQLNTNKEITRTIANHFHRPLILPNIPGCVLRLMFGGFAESLTGSLKVSSDKIQKAGFAFQFPELKGAIEDVYARNI